MHYHFKKNIPVFVMMKDGSSFVAKWHETKRKVFRFADRGPVKIKKVRFISFNKDRRKITCRDVGGGSQTPCPH